MALNERKQRGAMSFGVNAGTTQKMMTGIFPFKTNKTYVLT